jgi:hypothetical protein
MGGIARSFGPAPNEGSPLAEKVERRSAHVSTQHAIWHPTRPVRSGEFSVYLTYRDRMFESARGYPDGNAG